MELILEYNLKPYAIMLPRIAEIVGIKKMEIKDLTFGKGIFCAIVFYMPYSGGICIQLHSEDMREKIEKLTTFEITYFLTESKESE